MTIENILQNEFDNSSLSLMNSLGFGSGEIYGQFVGDLIPLLNNTSNLGTFDKNWNKLSINATEGIQFVGENGKLTMNITDEAISFSAELNDKILPKNSMIITPNSVNLNSNITISSGTSDNEIRIGHRDIIDGALLNSGKNISTGNLYLGNGAGALVNNSTNSAECIALGTNSGIDANPNTITIGVNSGNNMGMNSTVLGNQANATGNDSVSIGYQANAGNRSISIGNYAGGLEDLNIHIGTPGDSTITTSSKGVIRIGGYSDPISKISTSQINNEENIIGIGHNLPSLLKNSIHIASYSSFPPDEMTQHASSIVLNATPKLITTEGSNRLYISSIRNISSTEAISEGFQNLVYNPSTCEIANIVPDI